MLDEGRRRHPISGFLQQCSLGRALSSPCRRCGIRADGDTEHPRYLIGTTEAYSERLKDTFLAGLSNVVMTCSGSEANDQALWILTRSTGRTGDTLRGFARHGVTPDPATMGKHMGHGYPIAGVVTRPDLLKAFCADEGDFNTFGGSQIACAAALPVQDVIAAEDLQGNVRRVGRHLKSRLSEIAASDNRLTDVRGAGLFLGTRPVP